METVILMSLTKQEENATSQDMIDGHLFSFQNVYV